MEISGHPKTCKHESIECFHEHPKIPFPAKTKLSTSGSISDSNAKVKCHSLLCNKSDGRLKINDLVDQLMQLRPISLVSTNCLVDHER